MAGRGGDGVGPVLRGEIGREGFASGMQGTGIREQARAGLEGFAKRMATPIHAMRPYEWDTRLDKVT